MDLLVGCQQQQYAALDDTSKLQHSNEKQTQEVLSDAAQMV